jgi:hypothetical protein
MAEDEPRLSDRAMEALTVMYQEESDGLYLEGGSGVHRSSLNKLVSLGLAEVNDNLHRRGSWPSTAVEVTWQAKLTDAGARIAATAALNRIIDRLEEPPYSASCFDLDSLADAIMEKQGGYEVRNWSDFDFWSLAALHKNAKGDEVTRSVDAG